MANEFKVKKGLIVDGSGGTILDVQGSVGQLFSVTDSLTGDLFAVSDISGIPILNVNSSGAIDIDGTLTVDGALTGTSATFAGDVTIGTGNLSLTSNGTITTGGYWHLVSAANGNGYLDAGGTIFIRDKDDNNADRITIDTATGNTTFAGTIAASNLSGTNTGDQDLSGYLTSAAGSIRAVNLDVSGNGTTAQFLKSLGNGSFAWATPTDTNTTYSVGDNGLTQKNFTTTLYTKLNNLSTYEELREAIANAAGWESTYGSADPANVKWNFTEDAVEIYSSTDDSIGGAFKAVYMKAGETKRWTVVVKGSTSSASGMYIRLYKYDGNMPAGKTHVSNNFSSSQFVVEDTSGVTNWAENVAISTSWTTYQYNYKATSDGYVSMVVLNWTSFGTNRLYVRNPDIQTVYSVSDGYNGDINIDGVGLISVSGGIITGFEVA